MHLFIYRYKNELERSHSSSNNDMQLYATPQKTFAAPATPGYRQHGTNLSSHFLHKCNVAWCCGVRNYEWIVFSLLTFKPYRLQVGRTTGKVQPRGWGEEEARSWTQSLASQSEFLKLLWHPELLIKQKKLFIAHVSYTCFCSVFVFVSWSCWISRQLVTKTLRGNRLDRPYFHGNRSNKRPPRGGMQQHHPARCGLERRPHWGRPTRARATRASPTRARATRAHSCLRETRLQTLNKLTSSGPWIKVCSCVS